MSMLSYPAFFVSVEDFITASKMAYLKPSTPQHALALATKLNCLVWEDEHITPQTQRHLVALFSRVLQDAPPCILIPRGDARPIPRDTQGITAHFIAQPQLGQDDTVLFQRLSQYVGQTGGRHWFFFLGDALPTTCSARWRALLAQPKTAAFFSADPHQLWLTQTIALQQAVLLLLACYGTPLDKHQTMPNDLASCFFTQGQQNCFCLHGYTTALSNAQLTQLILSQMFSRVFPQAFAQSTPAVPATDASSGQLKIDLPDIKNKFDEIRAKHLPKQAGAVRYLPIAMPATPQDILRFALRTKACPPEALACFQAANYTEPVASLANTKMVVQLTEAFKKQLCNQYSLEQVLSAKPLLAAAPPAAPIAPADPEALQQAFMQAAESAWNELLFHAFNRALKGLQRDLPSQQWANQWSAEMQRSPHIAREVPELSMERHSLSLFLSADWQTHVLYEIAKNFPPHVYFDGIAHQLRLYEINRSQPISFDTLPQTQTNCAQTPMAEIDFIDPDAKGVITLQEPLAQTVYAPTTDIVTRLQCYALSL